MSNDLRKDVSKLGFGLMRLPRKGLRTDIEQVKQMVDMFMEAGCTYFDTAYVYPGSEAAAKKALVDRYPRDSYTLATKINAMMTLNEKSAKQQFFTSLERTDAGYFDFYLLHALMDGNYAKYDRYHLWDFAREQKAKGLIKHLGFSFHGGPRVLDQLLSEHPEVEFVQLQINYRDWENPSVASRVNYEVARKHGTPIVVMEPVKGGTLANPPAQIRELFQNHHPDMSPASWAIRFAASLDGILTVLSGMSSAAQMKDNLSYMKDFRPLDETERKIIQQAQRIFGNSSTIPCTACHYCTEGCPKKIAIPEMFTAMNKRLGNGQLQEAAEDYRNAASHGGRASDCIGCGKCEQICPQHLSIRKYLQDVAKELE